MRGILAIFDFACKDVMMARRGAGGSPVALTPERAAHPR
jgi:hypothetical protein